MFFKDKNQKSAPIASIPLTVPSFPNESESEFRNRWEKIRGLAEEKRQILCSDFTVDQIEEIEKKFGLEYEDTCNVSRLVRGIVCGDLQSSQIEEFLSQSLRNVSKQNFNEIKSVILKIISQDLVQESRPKQKSYDFLPINEALQKYPQIGEQNVTSSQLKLKYFPSPVRPSIKNWITDFHDNMGAGKHGAIDRGNYLFHSENGKRLGSSERQKLSVILKSLEERTPLSIDPERQMVAFESMKMVQDSDINNNENAGMRHEALGSVQNATVKTGPVPKRMFEQREEDIRNRVLGKAGYAQNSDGNRVESVNLKKQEDDIFQKYETYFVKERKKALSPNFLEARKPKVQKNDDEKKEGKKVGGNYFSSFSSSNIQSEEKKPSGKIAFSSPQEFAVEREAEETKERPKTEKVKSQEKKKEDVFSPSVISFPRANQKSQWQIRPRNFDDNESVKISGNIVDLRN